MKRILSAASALLLSSLLLFACAGTSEKKKQSIASSAPERSDVPALSDIEHSAVWSISERYDSKYTTIHYSATYEHDGALFLLTVNRSKKNVADAQSTVRDSKEIDGVVYTLYASKDDKSGTVTGTYYEAHSERFQYRISGESTGFFIEDHLSLDDAAALITSPIAPRGDLRLIDTEWDVYLRPEGCNLEFVIKPEDGGSTVRKLDSTFTAREEDGETVYESENGDEIVYTDGICSVRIRQTKRSGGNSKNYLTLSECKAILALLDINK